MSLLLMEISSQTGWESTLRRGSGPKYPGIGPIRLIKVTITNLVMRMMDSVDDVGSF